MEHVPPGSRGERLREPILRLRQGGQLDEQDATLHKTEGKISLNDTFWFMRGHYEGTYFDMSVDVAPAI